MRERQRERQRDRDRDRQTDRQTDIQKYYTVTKKGKKDSKREHFAFQVS